MGKRERRYEELDFTDDFIFWKVMTVNLDLCKELLELILNKKISGINYSSPQKTLEESEDARGIRLDVYLDGENEVYNVEMQTYGKASLPKRTRYHQGMIDLDLLERQAEFSDLKPTYIIFICTFDPFDRGFSIYTFENLCLEDTTLALGDESVKKFVNGTAKDVPGKMGEFIRFLSGHVTGDFSERLHRAVAVAKRNKRWRREYMTLFMRDREKYAEGRADGLAAGLAAGRINAVSKLLQKGFDKNIIMDLDYTEEEIRQAEESLLAVN